MTRAALLQMRGGIDPAANARVLVESVGEARSLGAAMLFTLNGSGAPNDVSAGFYQNFPAHPDFEALVEEVRSGKQFYNSVNLKSAERLRNTAFEVAEKYLRENGLLPVAP